MKIYPNLDHSSQAWTNVSRIDYIRKDHGELFMLAHMHAMLITYTHKYVNMLICM